MTFDFHNIQQREGRSGKTGLRYARKPESSIPPNAFLTTQPPFPGKSVKKTLGQGDRNLFEEEVIERQQFMAAKVTLAGTRDVSSFEDRTVLKFDPLEDYAAEQAGYATYNSGRYQSGTKGDIAFLKEGSALPEGRGQFTTIIRQNPFQTKDSINIKIKQ
jgi:hypothetical protein